MKGTKRHPGAALLLACVWACLFRPAVGIAQFAGGTGEPNDPYQIATAGQLALIGSDPNLYRKHYVLTADISMGGTTRSGPVIQMFRGTLDGKGHVVRNLRGDNGGLFNILLDEAEIRDLAIVNIEITGLSSYAAALAETNDGRVVNCYSTGAVIGRSHGAGGLIGCNWGTVVNCYSSATVGGESVVGGLVADNGGTVSFCYSTGEVSGTRHVGGLVGQNMGEITWSRCTATVTGLFLGVGGLVGENSGTIASCWADATVTGQYDYVGGLVGRNHGPVSWCYSTGSVVGQNFVGGLLGYNEGAVSACYSLSAVTGQEWVGGLAGMAAGRITMSYAAGTVMSWGWNVGGLAGALHMTGATRDCYFLAPEDGGGQDNMIATPLTDAQMRRQDSFVNWDFWGTAEDGPSDLWFMPVNAYPVLTWQTEVTGLKMIPDIIGLSLEDAKAILAAAGFAAGAVSYDFHQAVAAGCVIATDPRTLAPVGATVDLMVSAEGTYDWGGNAGDGTAANPYQIHTAGQLESLGAHPELWNRHFALLADVDMTGRIYAMALIAPDTNGSKSGFQGTPFSGIFDGGGHAIRGLIIRADTKHDYVGLFGMIAQAGLVDDLHLLDVAVKGGSGTKSYVGALAGYNSGTVTTCTATGVVRYGKGDGMVGFNDGALIDCQDDVTRL